LRSRLEKRNTDDIATIEQRLNAASNEISHISDYQYAIINNNFDEALAELVAVVKTSRLSIGYREAEEIINNFIER